jgi:hypothetical protein
MFNYRGEGETMNKAICVVLALIFLALTIRAFQAGGGYLDEVTQAAQQRANAYQVEK